MKSFPKSPNIYPSLSWILNFFTSFFMLINLPSFLFPHQTHLLRQSSFSLPIQKVITSIDCDLTADLSLKVQAERLKMNSSYLSTLFKKENGTTLTDYVNQKRVEHAIFLLNSTSLQVQSIAQQCGIPDVNYFSKTFKKIVGKTPMEYRKNIMHPSLLG